MKRVLAVAILAMFGYLFFATVVSPTVTHSPAAAADPYDSPNP